jgi:hypothetical protein
MYLEMDYLQKECCDCEDKQYRLDDARHFMNLILTQLYSREPLDKIDLATNLEELAYKLGIRQKDFPDGPINIDRPFDADALDDWKDWNFEYLKKLIPVKEAV